MIDLENCTHAYAFYYLTIVCSFEGIVRILRAINILFKKNVFPLKKGQNAMKSRYRNLKKIYLIFNEIKTFIMNIF